METITTCMEMMRKGKHREKQREEKEMTTKVDTINLIIRIMVKEITKDTTIRKNHHLVVKYVVVAVVLHVLVVVFLVWPVVNAVSKHVESILRV